MGAVYYVRTDGNNSNTGLANTPAAAWLTVGKAASTMVAGDTVHVTSGTYDERVSPANSGSSGSYITFKGDGYPIIRGFSFSSKSYFQVIGFEIFQGSTNYPYPAIVFTLSHSNNIIDNYIHAIDDVGIRSAFGSYANHNVIRSNHLDHIGLLPGLTASGNAIHLVGTNNLFEYNDISRCGDAFYTSGYHNVYRNNYLHDWYDSDISPDPHIDFIQNLDFSMSENLFERNYCLSNWMFNSHGGLLQGATPTDALTMHHLIYRLNAIQALGSSILVDQFCPWMKYYNNTVAYANSVHNSDPEIVIADYSTNGTFLNNIYFKCNNNVAFDHVYGPDFTATNGLVADYDCYYLSGLIGPSVGPGESHATNADPVFVDAGGLDVHIQASSPCIAHAGPQASTTGSGSTTNVVVVNDASLFSSGWGIVTGDSVNVSGNASATITNIDIPNNLIYFSSNLTWTNNAPIYLDGTLDIGAYLYRASGYSYGVALSINGSTLAATVTNPNVVRFVKFYLNGFEIATVASFPYTTTTSLSTGDTVQARAYALYADTVLAAVDQKSVTAPATINTTRANIGRITAAP